MKELTKQKLVMERMYDGGKEYEYQRATPSEIAHAYVDLARTTPPTVEEVGDNGRCLAYDGSEWTEVLGVTVRRYWHDQPSGDITHWLPMPPAPKGTQDETE